MYHKYLVSTTLGLFFGIIFAFSLNFSSEIFFVSLVICIFNIFIYKFSKRSFGVFLSKLPIIISLFFFFVSIGVVLGQVNISKNLDKEERFHIYTQNKNSFTGFASKIEKSISSQNFILNIFENNKLLFKLKVVAPLTPEILPGEKLSLSGKVEEEKIIMPDGKDYKKSFSLKTVNRLSGISGEMYFPKIISLEAEDKDLDYPYKILFSLENLKINLLKIFKNNLPYEGASLAAGSLLGDDSLFAKNDIKLFREGGLSHIIVLSGFNITILLFMLSYIFLYFRFRLKIRVALSLFFIFLFIIFVGTEPSLFRAGIMGSSLLLASILGRPYFAKQALFISAFFMLILDPTIALYDTSFHLSFLATFALLYISPIFEKDEYYESLEKDFKNKFFREIISIFKSSLIIQLFLTPYLIFSFGKFSLIGAILNMLVIPIVPFIMLFSFLAVLVYPLGKIFFLIFGYTASVFSFYVFGLLNFFSKNFKMSIDGELGWFLLFIIYLTLVTLLFFQEKKKEVKKHLK